MPGDRPRYLARSVTDVRAFRDRPELTPEAGDLPDDTVCYLTEDGELLADPFGPRRNLVHGTVTEAWLRFCRAAEGEGA
jgi:hypothetical protein